jgi:CIC family chloride channel protein
MHNSKLLNKILIWRVKYIEQRHFILILSLLVGILSGLAAILLKNAIHFTHDTLTELFSAEGQKYWLFILPALGILLTVLFVHFFVKDNIGHGVSRILFAISKKNSKIKSHNSYSSVVASTLTIGFGGSVGAEAPIVLTGAAIGSNIGKLLKLDYKSITLLLGCGTAGAVSGIFNAPIAGLLFALEVLMLDLTLASIAPLLIATVSAAMVSFFFMGKSVVFSYTVIQPFELSNIPFFIILGIFCGLMSFYFTKSAMYIESLYGEIKNTYFKWFAGSLVLILMIFLMPPLYGEGYDTIKSLLKGDVSTILTGNLLNFTGDNKYELLGFLILILFTKVIATYATTGGGGVGGVFAPTLFMGCVAGFFTGRTLNNFSFINVSESNFAVVGMAGMMAGVMHAPLTAIFLIAELTGGYELLIPLIITSTIAYVTIMYFEPHSIYTKRLAGRGELITHDRDKAILTLMQLDAIIEKDLITVSPAMSLGDFVKVIAQSKRNIFPVVNDEMMLIGVVSLSDIRNIIFNTEIYEETFVSDLMIVPENHVNISDSMDLIMKKFEESSAWNLPVVDKGKYVGFLSKSNIFSVYRSTLVEFTG